MNIVRLLAATAVVGFLLWALTAVGSEDRGWALRADRAIDQFVLGDRALQRDLLSARAGILRNYDPLNRETALTAEAARNIIQLASGDPALAAAARALAADLQAREVLVERFKTDNALLQNSLARFASLGAMSTSPQAARVTAGILELTLNTRPDAVRVAREALAAFEKSANSPSWICTHGAILIRLLPEVDGILTASRAVSVARDAAKVRRLILAHEAADEMEHVRRRVLFTAGVMLTIGVLAVLAFGLYARDRDLLRRAENERLSATVSGLLIGAQPHDLGEHIERALQQLALHLGGDRAALVLGAQAFVWQACNAPPAWWWGEVAALAARRSNWRDHVLMASAADQPQDALGAALAEAGVRSLLMVRAQPRGETEALLGFAAFDHPLKVRSDTAAGLLAALAAIRATLQRDRLEAERIRLERRLALARRMETVGAVASGVAHNFNNIIGAISGFSEMAELHTPGDSKARGDLAEIRHAVARARDLVGQILSFGRRAPTDPQWIGLTELVGETVRMLKASLPRQVRIYAQLKPIAGAVRGDPGQVQQALMNICHNAAHVQGDGGEVSVSLRRHELDHPRALSHGVIDPGVYGVVVVEDRGPGVPAAVLDRIFEPFFTTRRGGTGLGLSTAWEIVQAHGGTIDVRNAPGKGAAFSIWLPLDPRQAAIEALATGNGEAVLLVGFDPERLGADAEQVAVLGYDVTTASCLKAALALATERPFDLVLVAGGPCESVLHAVQELGSAIGQTPIVSACPGAFPEPAGGRLVAYPLREGELAEALTGSLPAQSVFKS